MVTTVTSRAKSRQLGWTVEQTVLATVAYSDQFDFPLAVKEIWQRLLTAEPVGLSVVQAAVGRLVTAKRLVQRGEWVVLAGRERLFTIRRQRQQIAAHKWQEVSRFVQLVRWIPWVQAVAVTGALAVDNVPSSDDDIDFMIVTSPRRLWLSRLVVTLLALLMGKRRSWQGEEKHSWCLNLWLDSDHLAMPEESWSMYTAYEAIQAQWVLDRRGVAAQFQRLNQWVVLVVANAWGVNQRVVATTERTWGWGRLGDGVDWVAYRLQRWYMQSHITREKVARGLAFFHPRDTRKVVERAWQQRRTKLKLPIRRVLVTGVFDLLHAEHRRFVAKAKLLGDELIIAIESDVRVAKMKGPGRPVHDQRLRVKNLQALKLADQVMVLPEQFSKPADHERLIAKLKPAVLAVSSHSPYLKEKDAILRKFGGRVMIAHQHNPEISTTLILKQRTS